MLLPDQKVNSVRKRRPQAMVEKGKRRLSF